MRVLVTGCSSGFGLDAARLLAERGDTVYATVRDPEKAVELQAAKDSGLPIQIVTLDVRDMVRAEEIVNEVLAGGGIDALVNNAGVSMFAALEDVSIDQTRQMFETNYLGPLNLIRLVLPHMRAQRHGRIVNVSSTAGYGPVPLLSTYTATKQALDSMSICLAAEVRDFGIRVCIVNPGAFNTSVASKLWVPDVPVDEPRYRTAVGDIVDRFKTQSADRDPIEVAEAIADALHDEDPPLRWLVGEDARRIYEQRRTLTDDEWVTELPTLPG